MERKRLPKRTMVSIAVILLLIPLTIYFFWRNGNRRYLLASLLIVIYTMIPFFMVFEARRPQAREIVVIAVMCAIAVASRAAFIMVPHFKPMGAIVMITAVALGAEAGFLTGAVSVLASNFIFGQGPWTPWQMFAFGVGGFLFGLIFHRKDRKEHRPLVLAVAGFVITFLLMGPILDTSAIFTMANMIDVSNVPKVFLAGIPVNLVHASACFVTMLLFSKPLLERLERIKIKYGMMDS